MVQISLTSVLKVGIEWVGEQNPLEMNSAYHFSFDNFLFHASHSCSSIVLAAMQLVQIIHIPLQDSPNLLHLYFLPETSLYLFHGSLSQSRNKRGFDLFLFWGSFSVKVSLSRNTQRIKPSVSQLSSHRIGSWGYCELRGFLQFLLLFSRQLDVFEPVHLNDWDLQRRWSICQVPSHKLDESCRSGSP